MTGVTLYQGSNNVNIATTQIIHSISKKWTLTPVPVTQSSRFSTYTSAAVSSGTSVLPVLVATGLKAKDTIYLNGASGTAYNTEIVQIDHISGSSVYLTNNLSYSYDISASVTKMCRFVTYDFNQIDYQIKFRGIITASVSPAKTVYQVRDILEGMIVSGGTVKVISDDDAFASQNMAIISVSLTENPQDPLSNIDVDITLSQTGKEGS